MLWRQIHELSVHPPRLLGRCRNSRLVPSRDATRLPERAAIRIFAWPRDVRAPPPKWSPLQRTLSATPMRENPGDVTSWSRHHCTLTGPAKLAYNFCDELCGSHGDF